MSAKALDISVIICTYTQERWHDLVAAVHSVQEQSLQPLEIIVVVDHNATLLRRARRQLSGVFVTENVGPRGLSGSRNSGVRFALGGIVAFLDDDAVASPGWLRQLADGYCDERVIGVGGMLVPQWEGRKPDWFPDEFNWVVGCSYRGMPRVKGPARNLFGANMSFRRCVFARSGMFRDGVGRTASRPMGCEETELCIRAIHDNPEAVILYDPAAVVYHSVSQRRATWRYFCHRCWSEGLSKAQVSRAVGVQAGLASEGRYIKRVLSPAVGCGVSAAVLHRDRGSFIRSAAILAGLACTLAGYAVGSLRVPDWRLVPHRAQSRAAIREKASL